MKIRCFNKPQGQHGATLVIFLCLIPVVMVSFVMVLVRMDIARAEAQRVHFRTQSRLLAESALACLQQAPPGEAPVIDARLNDVGEYAIEYGAINARGNREFTAHGSLENGSRYRFRCEIRGERRTRAVNDGKPATMLHEVVYRIEQIEEDTASEETN